MLEVLGSSIAEGDSDQPQAFNDACRSAEVFQSSNCFRQQSAIFKSQFDYTLVFGFLDGEEDLVKHFIIHDFDSEGDTVAVLGLDGYGFMALEVFLVGEEAKGILSGKDLLSLVVVQVAVLVVELLLLLLTSCAPSWSCFLSLQLDAGCLLASGLFVHLCLSWLLDGNT